MKGEENTASIARLTDTSDQTRGVNYIFRPMPTDHQPLDRILQLPCWSGKVDPAPLPGGITNKNYLVTDRGQKFVVRLGQDIPIHGVMRFNELAASRAAFEAGVSPEVIYAEPGALVLRYIEGRALSPELVRDPELLPARGGSDQTLP